MSGDENVVRRIISRLATGSGRGDNDASSALKRGLLVEVVKEFEDIVFLATGGRGLLLLEETAEKIHKGQGWVKNG